MSEKNTTTDAPKTKATKQPKQSGAALLLASFATKTPAEVAATDLMLVLTADGTDDERKACLLAIQDATAKAKNIEPMSSLDLPPLAVDVSEAGHIMLKHSMIAGPGNKLSLATFAKVLRDVEALKAGVLANFAKLRVEQDKDVATIVEILAKNGVVVPAGVSPILGAFPKIERTTKAEAEAKRKADEAAKQSAAAAPGQSA